jgi:hypothetical protein
MWSKDKMMKGATPLKQNQGTNAETKKLFKGIYASYIHTCDK